MTILSTVFRIVNSIPIGIFIFRRTWIRTAFRIRIEVKFVDRQTIAFGRVFAVNQTEPFSAIIATDPGRVRHDFNPNKETRQAGPDVGPAPTNIDQAAPVTSRAALIPD